MPHKLLLADDSVTIQRVIELTFADEDVQVHAVGDGMKAIASIQAERPDIVLADVGMPERDGYEVAAFIKGNPQLADIPVLLLTGAFEPVDETRARAVGCDGVLVKPFEPQMVINRVKDLLSGRRPAGLWTQAAPAAAGTGTQTPPLNADIEFKGGSPKDGPAASSASLEDYFDRLDAAFANLEGGASAGPVPNPPSAPPSQAPQAASAGFSPADDLGGWDPDLTGDPSRPRAVEAPPPKLAPNDGAAPPAAPPAPVPASMPSLAEAFAALLSAEQSRPVAPSMVRGAAQVNEDVIDEVVRRVVARLGDSVLDAAERLVREEIERIKRR
jgi:CheY-like chemotaxis protein